MRNSADRFQAFRYQVTFESESQVVFLIPEAVRVFGELRGRPLAEILELSIAVYAPLVELQ